MLLTSESENAFIQSEVAEEVVEEVAKKTGFFAKYLESLLPKMLSAGIEIIIAVVIFFVGTKLIKLLLAGLERAWEKHKVDKTIRTFLNSLIKTACYILLIMVILSLFGVTTASAIAVLGSVGITAGLALQGSLSNFAGGVLILLLKPFVVGDYIIDSGSGLEGTVKEIAVFYTKLYTIDKKLVIIPNGMLVTNAVTNVTGSSRRLMDLSVSISYDDDIKLAKTILKKLAEENHFRVDDDINVFVRELGENSVDLGLRYFVAVDNYWDAKWEMLEHIKLAFDEADITIPFRQLKLHIDNVSDDTV